MPRPEMQGEHPFVLDLHALEEVRHERKLLVVSDEPGIAVHHHQAHVLRPAHEHAQPTPVPARLAPDRFEPGDERTLRKPLRDRRKLPGPDALREHRRLDVGRGVGGGPRTGRGVRLPPEGGRPGGR